MTNIQDSSEVWRDIPGFNNRYAVSSKGDIRLKKSNKILSKHNYGGYLKAELDGKRYLIHRIVAQCFLLLKHGKDQVNHIDGNKMNNQFNNLEWVNGSENMVHAFNTGLKSGSHKGKFNELHHSSKKVIQKDFNGNIIKIFPSFQELERCGFTGKCVRKVCNKEATHHKGFNWEMG